MSTKAIISSATITTSSTKISQGKLLPVEDEEVELVLGPELVPVEGCEVETEPGAAGPEVSTAPGATPLGTALGTSEVPLGGGAVVAWATGLLVVAVTPEAETAPANTKTARARLNRTAVKPKRLRDLLLSGFDVECMNEKVTPPGVFEPHQAQARRLLYQLKGGMHKSQGLEAMG
jgi:hypothetical protein